MTRYTDDFLEFWQKYPKRWHKDSDRYYKVGKWEAMLEWRKLDDEDRKIALIAVKSLRTGEFVKDAHRWLSKRRFDDIELPKTNQPILSKHLTDTIFKTVIRPVDINDARNRNMRALERD